MMEVRKSALEIFQKIYREKAGTLLELCDARSKC